MIHPDAMVHSWQIADIVSKHTADHEHDKRQALLDSVKTLSSGDIRSLPSNPRRMVERLVYLHGRANGALVPFTALVLT